MNWELPDVQAGFRKGRRTRDQTANICCIIEKAKRIPINNNNNNNKTSTSASLAMLKHLTVYIIANSGKFLNRREYQTTLLTSWETCMQVKKQLDMEQQTSSKLGKEYIKALYCHSPYLTCMQSTSCKIPGWMNEWIDKSQAESRLLGEISMTSDVQIIPN